MKLFEKSIKLRKRPTKKDYYLLEYEISNYFNDGEYFRIPAKYNGESVRLQKNQLMKGTIINHPEQLELSNYFESQKKLLVYVIDYIKYRNIEPNTKTLKHYFYDNFNEVESSIIESYDYEDELKNDELFYEDSLNDEIIKELGIDKEVLYKNREKEAESDIYINSIIENNEVKKLHELDLEYIYLNYYLPKLDVNSTNTRVPNVLNYYKKNNNIKYLEYNNFDKKLIDSLIRFAISTGYKDGKKKARYKISIIRKLKHSFYKYGLWLEDNNYKINSNFRDFKLRYGKGKDKHIKYSFNDESKVISITGDELNRLKDFQFYNVIDKEKRQRLIIVRDLFMMQIYTGGLRISDFKLISSDVFKFENGELWYDLSQKKTSGILENYIPPSGAELFKKYKYKAPVYKYNQNYNEQLKVMAKLAGLDRIITIYEDYAHLDSVQITKDSLYNHFSSKLARKALVSILYNIFDNDNNRKYSLTQIADITGHSSNQIKKYLKIERVTKVKMMGDI
jgi:hypothetical protein